MTPTSKLFSALAIVIAATAAVISLISLPVLASRFKLVWGNEFYLLMPLPYFILTVLTISFRKTGATIALWSSLLIGGFGVYAMHATKDAMGVGMVPIALLLGCGVVLIVQLAHRIVTRRRRALN